MARIDSTFAPTGCRVLSPVLCCSIRKEWPADGFSLPRFVELVAANPAHIYGMKAKGSLHPGKDADIVLLDPQGEWVMGQSNSHSSNDWHAYEGRQIRGRITQVLSRGETVIRDDQLLATKGRGRYIHRILPETI